MSEKSEAKQLSPLVLTALIQQAYRNKTKVGEINGELGERIKHHQEHSNLNAKAFRLISAMHRMEELKREGFWNALQLYHDIAERELWGDGHAGDLVAMAKDGEPAPGPDEQAAQDNAVQLRKGLKILPAQEDAPDGPKRPPRGAAGDAPGTFRVN